MVGFDDDFAEDFKPPANNDEDNPENGEFFEDHHSNGENDFLELEQAESVRALTLKDGVNYEDARFD